MYTSSGSGWVTEGTDITYEIEVEECDEEIHDFKQLMSFGFKNLVPDKCVFLVLTGIGSNLALTARLEDKYKPYNTGVYDVVVDTWTG